MANEWIATPTRARLFDLVENRVLRAPRGDAPDSGLGTATNPLMNQRSVGLYDFTIYAIASPYGRGSFPLVCGECGPSPVHSNRRTTARAGYRGFRFATGFYGFEPTAGLFGVASVFTSPYLTKS